MPANFDDPVLEAFVGGTLLVSIAACLVLIARSRRGPLLAFEPRALVPWNAVGALLAGMLVFMAVATGIGSLLGGEPAALEPPPNAAPATANEESKQGHDWADSATSLTHATAQELILVGGALAFIAIYFQASRRDLGLPANLPELVHDVFIGGVVGIASLAPVRIIQGLLLFLWGTPEMESGHPLVKMLTHGTPNTIVMLLASFAAVVVAPVCEEISFRLLLQGWLEKWETMKLAARAESLPASTSDSHGEAAPIAGMTNVECRMTKDERSQETTDSSFVICHSSLHSLPERGYAGLPFGWFPIIVTSLLFGLAHFGYGPEPLSLFVLALILGYVYQRTHRIVPCIIAHAIFNAFTMCVLWRIVFHAA